MINKFYYFLLDIISKYYDICVFKRIGQYKIRMNISHKLPQYIEQHPLYSQNLGRIINFLAKEKNMKIIDIGANVGDSIALIRSHQNNQNIPILAIEGDIKYIKSLNQNIQSLGENIEFENSFVGEEDKINQYTSVNHNGTARLEKIIKKDDISASGSIKSLDSIIKNHPNFSDFNFIKIDTDGFDNTIIKSSIKLIEKNKPIIFFEYDPYFLSLQGDLGLDIFKEFKDIGYDNIIFYDNLGEYILSCTLDNVNLIEHLHNYITGKKGGKYYDICVFHNDDNDIFEKVNTQELMYYKGYRSNK